MRVLIIEDDEEAASYMAKALREAGHTVDLAADGQTGLFMAASEPYQALVVDRMLPKVDGLTIVQSLRTSGVTTPVLFLSALGTVEDRVRGLRAGGDDYLTKPFALAEFLARVDALGRRRSDGEAPDATLRVGDLELDRLSRTARRGDRSIDLLPREYKILDYMMQNAGRVVTRTMLLEAVWDYHFDPQTNVIDVHISRLRQKVDRDADQPLLHTVRGAGYMIRAEG